MAWTQQFPNSFSGTQQTQEVLKNHDKELKAIYVLLNQLLTSAGHAHTANGSDGGKIEYSSIANPPTSLPANGGTSASCSGNSAAATYATNAGNANTANTATSAGTCTGNSATATYANTSGSSSTCTGNSTTATSAGTCTGNSATATKFQTARNISGVSFDGTTNITIPYAGISGTPTIPPSYNSGSLLAGNGYQKLENGFIIQWASVGGNASYNIGEGAETNPCIFPIPFPSACLAVIPSSQDISTSPFAPLNVSIARFTKNDCVLKVKNVSGVALSGYESKYTVIAIGY